LEKSENVSQKPGEDRIKDMKNGGILGVKKENGLF
jgi:hypothetical protein